MIKVAALTSGQLVPSTRFRVRQYINPLQSIGIQVQEYIPNIDKNKLIPDFGKGLASQYQKPLRAMMIGAKLASRIPGILGSWNSQITWIGRELVPGRCLLEPLLKKPLVFDIDDAIWLASASEYSSERLYAKRVSQSISSIAKLAEVVIAGNRYLADWFADYARDIRIIPTAIDTERFHPELTEVRQKSTRFVIGWTGSAGNLRYLKTIEAPLREFMNKFAESELLIMADKPPFFKSLPSDRVRYIPWFPATEADVVKQMDVGLMPLPDNEWTKGKCSFKMLQYMACGIPVIVSPVGMNAEVLALGNLGIEAMNNSDWYEALVLFFKNRELADEYGKQGRTVAEKYFSQRVVVEEIAKVFRELS
ncbi:MULTISPECIES: glycosyltransferase family 4 protein [unclassified Coleofasciculus]|uniref:glycosyltransferase family 4 protein n=1 Tax=unclassified Coleofasciculus TaxID=2692782 RepID=UPI00187E260D|nr:MULTISPECIES: glycosyltransferase family 4 protein [unclassified Coleofasciculus]MBE9124679.1 glycosyltransferase family 4 protein [Coleofasciculus sp. LEGE 07081]MBE9147006.1 glycosyltransferase family 4 protein [Coleofasciculus sp. LEGE 07092]